MAHIAVNASWRPQAPYPENLLTPDEMDRAAATLTAWPEYRATPVRHLRGLARALGVGAILCKDESARFGAGGVKALGAPYGLQRLCEREPAARIAVAATDGNHGLALGWAAKRAGRRAVIYVGRDVDEIRLNRIRAVEADIVVIDGTYDDAVLAAERRAESDPTAVLVTDTDYQGGLPVCRDIMAGYALLASEAWNSDLADAPPTHVFIQCGVGGLASGVSAGLWRRMTPTLPRIVTVEPVAAACMLASLKAARSVSVSGDLRTRMCGLACGQMSVPAWNVLARAAFAAMTVGEKTAETMQQKMTSGAFGDAPLAVGDTGIAGIAGLFTAAHDPQWRDMIGLDATSRVFVVNSEGPVI